MELEGTAGVDDVATLAMMLIIKIMDKINITMEERRNPTMEPNTILQNLRLPDSGAGTR